MIKMTLKFFWDF